MPCGGFALQRALLFLVPLLTVGCIANDAPEVESAALPEDQATNTDAEVPNAVAEATPATAEAPLVETAISYSGTTPRGACTPIACQFESGSEDFHVVEVSGQPVKLVLTITYGEQAPGHEFYVGICAGDDEMADCGDYQTGPSPMELEVDVSSFASDAPIGISTGSVFGPGAMAGVLVFGEASFEVVGTLTARVG